MITDFKNSAWCFVGGWVYLLHTEQIQSTPELDIRRLTDAELMALRTIGISSREQIITEVARQENNSTIMLGKP